MKMMHFEKSILCAAYEKHSDTWVFSDNYYNSWLWYDLEIGKDRKDKKIGIQSSLKVVQLQGQLFLLNTEDNRGWRSNGLNAKP